MPQPEHTSFLQLYVGSFGDPMLLVLIVCALASIGIEMALNPATGWIDGTAILLAVQIVAVVTSVNNYRNELQFRRLNAVNNAISVKVVRDGAAAQVGASHARIERIAASRVHPRRAGAHQRAAVWRRRAT